MLCRQSLGVATFAKVLAEQTGLNPELAFTSGLLHDIGQLLMYISSPHSYLQVIVNKCFYGIPLTEAE